MSGFNFDKLAEDWRKPLVPRTEVGTFSGGILHPRTMSNKDSLGEGPPRVVVNKRVYYEPYPLAHWMKEHYGQHRKASRE